MAFLKPVRSQALQFREPFNLCTPLAVIELFLVGGSFHLILLLRRKARGALVNHRLPQLVGL